MASEALERELRIQDEYIGGVATILARIRTDLPDEVAEAEIILLCGHPGGLEYDLPLPNIHACFDAVDAVEHPEEYEGAWIAG